MIKVNLTENKNNVVKFPTKAEAESVQINDSELKKRFESLQSKKQNGEKMTVKEQLQLGRLKKYGDSAFFKNKLLQEETPKPTKPINLAKLNQAPNTINRQKADNIINLIYEGNNLIDACNMSSIKPKDFLKFIDLIENSDLKQLFINARICLAEYYIYRREQLEKDLLSGRVDSSTYSVLSNDYKYLAGKFAPLAYGEKIRLDALVLNATPSAPNTEQIKELNNLLNAPHIMQIEDNSTPQS